MVTSILQNWSALDLNVFYVFLEKPYEEELDINEKASKTSNIIPRHNQN